MSEFLLWFWRPIAEFLGGLALIAGLIGVYAVWCILRVLFRSGKP